MAFRVGKRKKIVTGEEAAKSLNNTPTPASTNPVSAQTRLSQKRRINKRLTVVLLVVLLLTGGGYAAWRLVDLKKLPFIGNNDDGVKTYYEVAKENASTPDESATIDFGLINAALIKNDTKTARQLLGQYNVADLSDDNTLVFKAFWGRLLAGENKYDELVSHAQEVLDSSEISAYPELKTRWETIKQKAEIGENPYPSYKSEEDVQ
ncbi:MAG: hypothetical protein M3Q79_03365 [bacterium]|nr:hypothetical protein [bacterium]